MTTHEDRARAAPAVPCLPLLLCLLAISTGCDCAARLVQYSPDAGVPGSAPGAAGQACSANPGAPCVAGVLAGASGQERCVDSPTNLDAGVACGPGQVCDGLGACVSCTDHVHNGDETDVDCGGRCGGCNGGGACRIDRDCLGGRCGRNGLCARSLSFTPVATQLAPNAAPITAADFNGDGWLDLAVENDYSAQDSVLFNEHDGGFRVMPLTVWGYRQGSITSADVNGDGVADLLDARQANNGGSGLCPGGQLNVLL